MVHGQGQAAFGPSAASRLSEASGLPEEVLSVLKVADFVFTENPLQALVPRTLGMAICGTSVWPLAVPVGQAGQGACPVRLQDPRGFPWLVACPGLLCGYRRLHRFTR